MSKITLTDRISVSVRAKTDTESNQQKVDTGNNIARALGGTNANDVDAANVGTTSKPTITDENGNEWVSMQDIIDAGKKMQQNGAFHEEEIHEGIVAPNGYIYNISNPVIPQNDSPHWDYADENGDFVKTRGYNAYTQGVGYSSYYLYSNSHISVIGTSKIEPVGRKGDTYFIEQVNGVWTSRKVTDRSPDSLITISTINRELNGKTYELYTGTTNISYSMLEPGLCRCNDALLPIDPNNYETLNHYGRKATIDDWIGFLFGPTHKTGGSLIDWNAPNAEIERQIKELHETWDVSEHEGAVTANGTYVLAGPIEYNDADPGSHSSGDF